MNADQAELARATWSEYGKAYNSGDLYIGGCCAYALAKYLRESLLFKGNVFIQTDIRSAIKEGR